MGAASQRRGSAGPAGECAPLAGCTGHRSRNPPPFSAADLLVPFVIATPSTPSTGRTCSFASQINNVIA